MLFLPYDTGFVSWDS